MNMDFKEDEISEGGERQRRCLHPVHQVPLNKSLGVICEVKPQMLLKHPQKCANHLFFIPLLLPQFDIHGLLSGLLQ